ncbi:hypothetical protein PoB_000008300 [Plakobranchus ocellatus]|uniref:Uncharacterized protein n=1 Tax=Plakobranchus ocellatus TaxID=259542 RepID=A0AAV3XSF0_9GAST|nr:hypothetical protein PoB_000008300 [Plakobranchus ocellatus]
MIDGHTKWKETSTPTLQMATAASSALKQPGQCEIETEGFNQACLGADGGARTRDRRVAADLRADSRATVPPMPPKCKEDEDDNDGDDDDEGGGGGEGGIERRRERGKGEGGGEKV